MLKGTLMQNSIDLHCLCTAEELSERYPNALSTTTIKYYAKNRDYNGLAEAGAVFRIGRHLMFSPEHFANWLINTKSS